MAQLNHLDDNILQFLKTHRGKGVAAAIEIAVVKALHGEGPMKPDDVSRHLWEEQGLDVPVEYVWRLAADGKICSDLSQPKPQMRVAAPVPINVARLNRKVLFRLPFCLVEEIP